MNIVPLSHPPILAPPAPPARRARAACDAAPAPAACSAGSAACAFRRRPRTWENRNETSYSDLMGFYGGLMGFNMIYPLVMTNIAIENDH